MSARYFYFWGKRNRGRLETDKVFTTQKDADSYGRRHKLEGAGFDVHDLGANVSPQSFIEAVQAHDCDLVCLSALLTTTMPYMKVVIDTMKEQGIRDDYIILVGGAPLNQEFGEAIGADAYCRDAAVAADTAKQLVAEMRAG